MTPAISRFAIFLALSAPLGCAGAPPEQAASGPSASPAPGPSASVTAPPTATAAVSEIPAAAASAAASNDVKSTAPPRPRRAVDHGPNADLDGDGFSDIVLRWRERAIAIIPGSKDGPRDRDRVTFDVPGTRWNFGMAATGDFNGDGRVDLAIGTSLASGRAAAEGGVAIFGGVAGQLPRAVTTLLAVSGLGASAELGAAVAAGDFDGDGFDDLLASAPATSVHGAGKVVLFRGGRDGIATTPSLVLEHPDRVKDSAFGASLANLGDVDGDGIDDVAIGAYRADGRRGAVLVYRGAKGGIASAPWVVLRPPRGVALFGYTAIRAGDVDGDGHADLLVACSSSGDKRAFLYLARGGVLPAEPSQTLFAKGHEAMNATLAGDVNGDGKADLLVGDVLKHPFGGAFLLFGAAGGYDDAHPVDLPNRYHAGGNERSVSGFFGHATAAAGDVNGDGFDDLLAASQLATFYWPGGKAFTAGEPVILEGTTAARPTFSE